MSLELDDTLPQGEASQSRAAELSRRAVVPPARKAMLLARALSSSAWPSASRRLPVLPEAMFLIEAVEPPQNRRRGDQISAVEYLQAEDTAFKNKQAKALVSEVLAKLER